MRHPSKVELEELLPKAGALSVLEVSKLLKQATMAAEILTKDSILPKNMTQVIMLSTQPFQLEHFPIRDVFVNGMEMNFDPSTGVLYPHLPPHSYKVSYKVGYEGDQVPEIVGSLILNLAAYKLSKNEDFKEAAIVEAGIIKANRLRGRERSYDEAY